MSKLARRGVIAAAVAAIAISLPHLPAAPALGAAVSPDGSLCSVLAPHRHGTARGNRVEIRIRAKPSVTELSAEVGSTSIEGRLARRSGGRIRVASLAAGRATGIRHGINRLRVHCRAGQRAGDLDIVRFALVGRSRRLVRVKAPRRSSRTETVRVRLAQARAKVRLRLNGRRVAPSAFARGRGRLRRVRLDADNGLRHGRNRLKVTAVDRKGGGFAVRRRHFVITRDAPIPGAGRDRRARTHRSIVLDARTSRAAHLPPSLRYRWRIVRKPRGSDARLRRSRTERPRLKPDRPGRYRLRMTVTERLRPQSLPSRLRGRAARPASAPGPGRGGAKTAASTTVTIAAHPEDVGIGVAVDTDDARSVTVGTEHYPPPDSSKPLQLVVLDRSTLGLISNSSFSGDDAGTGSLADAVSKLTGSTIAIITTRSLGAGRAPLADAAALANVNRAVKTIGGRPISPGAALTGGSCFETIPVCGGFSAIGTTGFDPGDGAVNSGLGGLGDIPGGALTGYLQLDQTGRLHTFVNGDYVHFDTTAAGTSPASAAIRVGGTTYRSQQLPAKATGGAYVLVLDAGTLRLRDSGTFAMAGLPAASIVPNLQGMAALLGKYVDDPSALVFVQSIGKIFRWDAYQGITALPRAWNRITGELQSLGGHKSILNSLDGTLPGYDGTYAQVAPGGHAHDGPGGSPDSTWAQVATQAWSRSPGRLTGALGRNDSSQFFADNATATEEFGDRLTMLAYQDRVPWPKRNTPARRSALRCIASLLQVPYPIEGDYTNENLRNDWGSKQTTLDHTTYAELKGRRGCDTSSFGADDYDVVSDQLDAEFSDVVVVWSFVQDMSKPFTIQKGSSQLALARIADDVRKSTDPPADAKVDFEGGDIAEELLYMLAAVPDIGEAAFVFEIMAGDIGLVEDTTLDQQGKPLISGLNQTEVDSFAGQLDNEYKTAELQIERIGDILVGDWGKLSTTNQLASGPWAWDSGTTVDAIDALSFAARRFAWTTLFPKAYGGLLRGTRGDSDWAIQDDTSRYTCEQPTRFGHEQPFHPFHTQEAGGVSPIVDAGSPFDRENWVFSTPTKPNDTPPNENNPTIYSDFSPDLPDAGILREMFLDDAPNEPIPPLTPLAFALSISHQLQVLTIYHETSEDANGNTLPNVCNGKLTSWPPGLG